MAKRHHHRGSRRARPAPRERYVGVQLDLSTARSREDAEEARAFADGVQALCGPPRLRRPLTAREHALVEQFAAWLERRGNSASAAELRAELEAA